MNTPFFLAAFVTAISVFRIPSSFEPYEYDVPGIKIEKSRLKLEVSKFLMEESKFKMKFPQFLHCSISGGRIDYACVEEKILMQRKEEGRLQYQYSLAWLLWILLPLLIRECVLKKSARCPHKNREIPLRSLPSFYAPSFLETHPQRSLLKNLEEIEKHWTLGTDHGTFFNSSLMEYVPRTSSFDCNPISEPRPFNFQVPKPYSINVTPKNVESHPYFRDLKIVGPWSL